MFSTPILYIQFAFCLKMKVFYIKNKEVFDIQGQKLTTGELLNLSNQLRKYAFADSVKGNSAELYADKMAKHIERYHIAYEMYNETYQQIRVGDERFEIFI